MRISPPSHPSSQAPQLLNTSSSPAIAHRFSTCVSAVKRMQTMRRPRDRRRAHQLTSQRLQTGERAPGETTSHSIKSQSFRHIPGLHHSQILHNLHMRLLPSSSSSSSRYTLLHHPRHHLPVVRRPRLRASILQATPRLHQRTLTLSTTGEPLFRIRAFSPLLQPFSADMRGHPRAMPPRKRPMPAKTGARSTLFASP